MTALQLVATLALTISAATVVNPESRTPAHAVLPEIRFERINDSLAVGLLSPGVWMQRSSVRIGGSRVEANGLLLVSRGEALLVDTPWNDAETVALLDWVRNRLRVRVTGAIVTHFHADRAGGARTLARLGIPLHTLAQTLRLLPQPFPASLARPFSVETSVRYGGESVTLFHPGAGHTRDNTVVWIGRTKTLFGGCLIKSAASTTAGNIADADLGAWAPTLEAVRRRFPGARVVIPGHGEPGTLALLEHTARIVERAAIIDAPMDTRPARPDSR